MPTKTVLHKICKTQVKCSKQNYQEGSEMLSESFVDLWNHVVREGSAMTVLSDRAMRELSLR